MFTFANIRAPVAQWVKRWPTDLAVPSLKSPAQGKIFSIAHSLSLSPVDCPDMTEILWKWTYSRKSSIIHCLFYGMKHLNMLQNFLMA